MAYIWSYLRRYPKWLAMNFTAAILFVIANLGLPTVLARMIDEGLTVEMLTSLYLCLGHVWCGLNWYCWSCAFGLCGW